MARTRKKGLDYFPFDVDFFQDIRIRKLIKYQGGKAVTVYALLLCTIYRNGYYAEWDKELPFIISEQTGYTEAYIQEVIECCMNIGLLSRELFESDKILTSKGIQMRYININSKFRKSVAISEYNLVSAVSEPEKEQKDEPKKNASRPKPMAKRNIPANAPIPPSQSPASPVSPSVVTPPPAQSAPQPQSAPVPLAESVAEMKRPNTQWSESVCMRYNIPVGDLPGYIDDFALQCSKENHPSIQDAKSHFCRWLNKQTANKSKPTSSAPAPNDYKFNGGFGGKDV